VAVSENNTRTITGFQREDCDPKTTKMCRLPRQQRAAVFSSRCAERMLAQHTREDLREHCPFYCSPSHGGVLLTQVAEDKYVITNPIPNLTLSCKNTSFVIPIGEPGALEVTLTCDCILSDGEVELISRQYPCFSGVGRPSIVHVLPAAWTSLSNFTFDPLLSESRPIFQNFSRILNSDWTVATPSFMVHQNISPALFDHVSLPESWWDVQDLTSIKYIAIFIWLGALSVLLGYIGLQVYLFHVKFQLLRAG